MTINHAEAVREYLRQRRKEELVCEISPFVTISREAGAGGHTLAREILRRLEDTMPEMGSGWEVFDYKLCLMIAQDEELNGSFSSLMAEEYKSEYNQAIYDLLSGKTQQYHLYKRVFEIVRALATLGRVVVVGRAGACVTADMPHGISLRLVADFDTRVYRMMQLLEIPEDEAVRKVREQDRDRYRLVKDFFGKDIHDPHLYDVVFNTDRITLKEMAEVAADMIRQRMVRYDIPIR
jgi:cytidylate kinase